MAEAQEATADGDATEMPERARVWVSRYDDGRRNDALTIETTETLAEAAPARAVSDTATNDALGTFAEFRERVENGLRLNLPARMVFSYRITDEIEDFWDVIWEARQ